jgi:hypothetical protein
MYLAYAVVLLGEALVIGHTALLLYTAAWALGFHVMALGEESLLRRRFGERYERYLREVPRWIDRRSLPRSPPADLRLEPTSSPASNRNELREGTPPTSPRGEEGGQGVWRGDPED